MRWMFFLGAAIGFWAGYVFARTSWHQRWYAQWYEGFLYGAIIAIVVAAGYFFIVKKSN